MWTIQREMLLSTQLCQLASNTSMLPQRLVPNVFGDASFECCLICMYVCMYVDV